ncbi:DNA polymerase III [Nocardia nova SH22a]|uniref:DNA polymerase III n=1 Tax=Nocardia nova SH22a TaxID=1415166 RepID=W5TCY1_9NOCA|nr:exonuclease domain-containing protein [Nocardia nova]AHH17034.1 DNA polymerase III [Nocardia nova SH22a]
MTNRFAAQPGWNADPTHRTPVRWLDRFRRTSGVPQDIEPEAVTAPRLASLVGTAARFAVIDVETTGLHRSDRVVEITVLTLDHTGTVTNTFDTVVNPMRDVGPSWIHGLSAADVADAPIFDEIAHTVAGLLDGAVVVAHNRPFDTRMVGFELGRSGIDVEWGAGLDTLAVTRCKLGVACFELGIRHEDQHRALGDARATAHLLQAVADRFPRPATPTSVTRYRTAHTVRVRARDRETIAEPVPFLADISQGLHTTADVAPYEILLDQALADLQLTTEERAELQRLASDLGLDPAAVRAAHTHFLHSAIDAALEDAVVTDAEIDRLLRVAALLDLPAETVTSRTRRYRTESVTVELSEGTAVCFTGDDGRPREELVALAQEYGLVPAPSMTKAVDVLVAADPATMSGKAKSAHKFGKPVVSTKDFVAALHSGRAADGTRLRVNGTACVCDRCGTTWTASRRSKLCRPCLGTSRAAGPLTPR